TLQEYVKKLIKSMHSIDKESQDLLLQVDKSTNRLISSIQDIITLNRYNQKTDLIKKQTDITESLRTIYDEIAYLSQSRKMKLKLEATDNLPKINIEKKSFELLLLNLMMNAVRFTPDYGNITLGARKAMFHHEKINDEDAVVVYVQDNGIGIPEREQENIFKAFFELGDIYTHRSGTMEFRSSGLGIGLAIVKRIVDLHNGKIWIKSKEREGTTVFVSLPLTN
ncbi:MAG: ATP-binding protein, partial [Candidatus Cloacimonetes bacterium]|nr:ATP-binding protein [Candidatus Cloacimonadota bacterium]